MAMSDNSMRHFVAFTITLVAIVSFIAGYLSAGYGWWWTAFAALIVYGGVFKALK
jgi:CHASE2 domain-containing sensor protein